ncbi:ABC transporter ATP-binding protein [Microbacterium caowuchunii]|uniref:ABC transporter ATP-binding protein n=1 Tax=Microbacterium caowuchunii TaxID=2614638 RepID=UPI001EE89EBF|nr:ABC transporter ATP-binding protein [Microbacterium caowuchunii]
MDSRPPLLQVSGLNKTYASSSGDYEAIRDLSFELRAGELVCLVGPSGSGKTTLLKCISGLMAPTRGEVRLSGTVISGAPRKMAVVFQEYGRSLFPWMRVEGNVGLPLKVAGVRTAERNKAVSEALHAVGLEHAGRKYPWQLSGGMQQRVAIARALAYKPEILLMDEPFAAVDAQTRAELEDLIRRIWKDLGVTVLFVTHDIDESVYLGERVLVLSGAPTVLADDVVVDLPEDRNQLETRALPRFAELRTRVYALIQEAKHYQQSASAASKQS